MLKVGSKSVVATLSLVCLSLTLLSGVLLSAPSSSADNDSHIDDVSIIVPISCNLNGTNTTHSKTVNPGTTEADIGSTTLKAFCNDNNGFAIYAIGYTNDTDGNNTLVSTTLTPTLTIPTGTNTTGNSSWAMKLTKETNTSQAYQPSNLTILSPYTAYSSVPASWTKVANYSAQTDTTLGAVLYTTYQVHISTSQAADTYTGKVKYTLVHPQNEVPLQPVACASGVICYNPNGGTVVGTMGQQTANANASVTLLASNFSRAGYGFAGWNTEYDYSGTFYGPNETITTPSDMSAGLPLYAVWVESQGDLQGWTGCSSLTQAPAPGNGTPTLASVTALTDKRDNQTYAVAKLADGKCWMIENLRLGSTNSDNATGALAQGYGSSTDYGNFSGLANSENNFSDSTTANSLYYSGTQSGTATINIGTTNYPSYRMPRYNDVNTSARASNPTSGYNNIYSYGNYYTWHTAIADTTAYTLDNISVTNTSICPSGWRLPKGGNKTRIESNDDNDFWNLAVDILNSGSNPSNYSSSVYPYYNGAEANQLYDNVRKYPNNFVLSGRFYLY